VLSLPVGRARVEWQHTAHLFLHLGGAYSALAGWVDIRRVVQVDRAALDPRCDSFGQPAEQGRDPVNLFERSP
jgi:hypothetical protein